MTKFFLIGIPVLAFINIALFIVNRVKKNKLKGYAKAMGGDKYDRK